MSWARLDDGFHSHSKVLAAGNAAVGLYVRALAYCAGYATDGFVAKAVAESFGVRKELEQLCAVGLWERVAAGEIRTVCERVDGIGQALPDVDVAMPGEGYFVADFLHFNPTKSESESLRERRRESGRAGGQQTAAKAVRDSNGRFVSQASDQADVQAGAWGASKQVPGKSFVQHPSFPDPTRPVNAQPPAVEETSARENGAHGRRAAQDFELIGNTTQAELARLRAEAEDDDIPWGADDLEFS